MILLCCFTLQYLHLMLTCEPSELQPVQMQCSHIQCFLIYKHKQRKEKTEICDISDIYAETSTPSGFIRKHVCLSHTSA